MTTTARKLASKTGGDNRTRRSVDLQVAQIGLWSATKVSFLVALGFSLAGLVMSLAIWLLVSQLGVFNALNELLTTVGTGGAGTGSSVDIASVLSLGRIMGFAALAGLVNLVFGTLLGIVTAWLYNVCVKLVGGLEVHFTNVR